MTAVTRLVRHNRARALALVGVTLAFFLWQMAHLDGFRWDYDEGPHMMMARLVRSGYRLYTEVYSARPPLLIYSIALAFAISGASVQAARMIIVVYSTIGLLATGLLAREMGGYRAGLGAIVLLALSPDFFVYSRACMGDIPSMSMAVVAIFLALVHRRSGSKRWLALSGLAISLALLLTPLPLFVVPLLGLIVMLSEFDIGAQLSKRSLKLDDRWPTVALDFIWLGTPLVLSCLCCLLIYDFGPIYDQLVGSLLQGRVAFPPDPLSNWQKSVAYLVLSNAGLSALAIYGLWVAFARRLTQAVPMTAWLLLTALGLVSHSPLWDHLLTSWLFPLSILAGIALDDIGRRLTALARQGLDWSEARPLAVGLAAALVYLCNLPAMIRLDEQLLAAPTSEAALDAVHFLEAATSPQDLVITDEQLIAFWARRDVPPPLTDTSFKRVMSGRLTTDQLVALTQEYNPAAIVLWNRAFALLPGYRAWIEDHYMLARDYGGRRCIYVRTCSAAEASVAGTGPDKKGKRETRNAEKAEIPVPLPLDASSTQNAIRGAPHRNRLAPWRNW